MPILQSIAVGEWFVVGGLVLNIAGVYALTVSSILGKKPARTLLYLWRHVDRESPEDTEVDAPVDTFGPVGGGFGTPVPPTSLDKYDSVWEMARNQLLGVSALFLGFGLQALGTLL